MSQCSVVSSTSFIKDKAVRSYQSNLINYIIDSNLASTNDSIVVLNLIPCTINFIYAKKINSLQVDVIGYTFVQSNI